MHPVVRALVESGKQLGLTENRDFNGASMEGIGVNQVTQRGGRRWSAAAAFLRPALARPNLSVVTGALVEGVRFEGRRAVGVDYVEHQVTRTSVGARREVILCGGAVNSPQLLLLSGVGPVEQLKAHAIEPVLDLPGVGENLQDHLATAAQFRLRAPISMLNAGSRRELARYLVQHRGMLTSCLAEGNGFVRTRPELEAPDVQLVFAAVLYSAEDAPPEHGFSVGAILLQPRSRGRVFLRSPHPTFPAGILGGYLTDPEGEDIATLREGLRLCRRLALGSPPAAYRGDELLPGEAAAGADADLDEYIREHSATLYHPVGTCRMGHDRLAVVDDELRVRGLEGLRVADASVMPVVPRANTNAPTIMIGEKAADLVRASASRSAATAAG